MNKGVITEKQGISLIILYSVGIPSVIVTALGAQNDLWISIILATLFMIPMGLVYAKLVTISPNMNVFDLIYTCWGKALGKILILLYLWFLFNISVFALKDLSEFFRLTVGPETPMTIPMLGGVIASMYALKKDIDVFGRMASFFLLPILIFIILDCISLLPSASLHNIQPILYNGWSPVLKGAINTISFPLGEIVVFTVIFNSLKEKKEVKSTFTKGIIVSSIILLLTSTITILVIGPAVASTYYFPSYVATSRINIGNFFQSIEVILAFMFAIGGFVNFTILYLCSAKSISSLFGVDNHRTIIIPLGLLILNFTLLVTESTREYFRFTAEIWPYYAIPFQIIFPIITLVIAQIKFRNKQTQKS